MASYGKIYEFVRDSQNGAEIIITISKKNYTGESMVRPLGRAPLLKRENNGHIFGTSLEIYAECKVDGEFAQFYTSSADEFLVEVWKDQVLIWSGFISPELYSEPDIAPPYDVQIIATDGLGELRNYIFLTNGLRTIYDHLRYMLDYVEKARGFSLVSNLRFNMGDGPSEPVDLFKFRIDLEHEVGKNCYEVLQRLLASINASITLQGNKWLIFRETDFIHVAGPEWVEGVQNNGLQSLYSVQEFGSMTKSDWWPIGQMSTVIESAKKRITIESPANYKKNILSSSWQIGNSAIYKQSEGVYILPDEGSYMTQKLDFEEEVGYRLALRVSARNVGSSNDDQDIGIKVKVLGHMSAGYVDFWLVRTKDSDRGPGSFAWRSEEDWIEGELARPTDSDLPSDAQDIDIILPFFDARNEVDDFSFIYAKSIEVTVFNPEGIHDINVYGISLSKYDQINGYQADVSIDNGARETGDTVEVSMFDGGLAPESGYLFMAGIPLLPASNAVIQEWRIGDGEYNDYMSFIARDYAVAVAIPRMIYKGVLNVARRTLPLLFLRDNTYYFPRTYTYDLYNDELEVDLISIPAADLTIDTIQVGQIAQSQGVPSSGGSGGGGGIGGVDLSGYAKKEDVATLADHLASMWSLDDDGNLVTDRNVIIKNNLIVTKDTSTGGTGTDQGVSGTVTGIRVDSNTVLEPTNGIVDMSDVLANLEVDVDLSDYYTKQETLEEIAKAIAGINIPSLDGYATEEYVTDAITALNLGQYATTASLATLQTEVDNIEAVLGMDEEAAGIINTWNEVKAFLGSIEVDDDLASILERMNADIATRALDSDLDTLAGRVGVNELAIADNAGNIKKNFDAIEALGSSKADKATTLAGYGITDAYTKTEVAAELAKYILKEAESQTIKGDLIIEGNLVVTKDTSSGGTGSDSGVAGTLLGITVNGTTYNEPVNGILTLPDYYTQTEVDDKIAGVDVSDQLKDYAKLSDIPSLEGYAKLTDIPTTMAWDSVTGKPSFATVATSGKYGDLTGRPTIPSKTSQIAEDTNLYFTNARAVSALADTLKDYVTKAALASDLGEYASKEWVNEKGYITGITLTGDDYISVNGYQLSLAIDAQGGLENTGQGLGVGNLRHKLTFGDKSFDGGADKTITAADLGALTGITKAMVTTALGYTPYNSTNPSGYISGIDRSMVASAIGSSGNAGKVLSSTGGDLGWVSLPTSLPASDVYAWAKKSSLALADVPDLSSKYLSVNGGTIGSGLSNSFPLLISSTNAYTGLAFYTSGGTGYISFQGGSTWGVTDAGWNNSYTLIHSGNIGSQQVSSVFTGSISDGNTAQYTDKALRWFSGIPRDTANLPGFSGYQNGLLALSLHTGGATAQLYFHANDGLFYRGNTAYAWKTIAFTDSNVASAQALTHSNGTVGATVNSSGTVTGVRSVDFASNNLYDVGSNLRQARYIYAGWLGSKTGENLSFGANNGTHMLINSSGNILIGTTTDSGYKLDVNGTARISGAVTMSSTLSVTGAISIGSNSGASLYLARNSANYIWSSVSGGYMVFGCADRGDTNTTNASLLVHSYYVSPGYSSGIVDLGHQNYRWKKLHCVNADFSGNLVVSGDTATGSDIRFKDRIADHRIALESIAQAPLFTFKWNDRDDDVIHLGTSAQYWEGVAPWLVKGTDFKVLDYSTLGVAIGISLANKTLNLEERIKILEKENKALKEEIRRIQYGS